MGGQLRSSNSSARASLSARLEDIRAHDSDCREIFATSVERLFEEEDVDHIASPVIDLVGWLMRVRTSVDLLRDLVIERDPASSPGEGRPK